MFPDWKQFVIVGVDQSFFLICFIWQLLVLPFSPPLRNMISSIIEFSESVTFYHSAVVQNMF